jgi:hypothetical protein
LELLGEGGADLMGATQRMAITYVKATCSNSNTGDVSIRIGFAASSLTAITNNSANGVRGVFTSHPGIARGGGEVNANGGATLAIGAAGEAPRLTCSAATGGAWRLIIGFVLVETDA